VYVLIFVFCCGTVVEGLVCLRRYLSFILSQGRCCTRYNITLRYLLACLAKWLGVFWYSLSLIAFLRSVSLSTVGTRVLNRIKTRFPLRSMAVWVGRERGWRVSSVAAFGWAWCRGCLVLWGRQRFC